MKRPARKWRQNRNARVAFWRRALHLLLCLVLGLQSFGPSMAAARAPVDIADMLCAPNGLAPAARASIEATLKLVFEATEDTQQPDESEHCAACILAAGAVLPDAPSSGLPADAPLKMTPPPAERSAFYFAQGPPLGGRAPPAQS